MPAMTEPTVPDTIRPATGEQLLAAVRWAVADEVALEVAAAGSKRGFGRPVAAGTRLDLSAIAGIELYEPEELVLTLRPGTPIAEIETLLAARQQCLAFEPPDLGPLLGGAAGSGTIGGAVACNLGGPRRIKTGAARDHILGFHAVSGRGEAFKSGGRVVKNVTGFDLSKLMAGSFGTLALTTELTVRALPAAEQTRSVLVLGLGDEQAMAAMSAALGSSHEVSGAAHLPARIAAGSAVDEVSKVGGAVTALRIEGFAPSVVARTAGLRDVLAPFGALAELPSEPSAAFWREIRDVRYFAAPDDKRQVWRLSVPPMAGAVTAATIKAELGGEAFYDWGGGLIWLAMPPRPDAGHAIVRAALPEGHATLIRAETAIRRAVPVFQPQASALVELARRVKQGLDPKGVLNPGRMVEGM